MADQLIFALMDVAAGFWLDRVRAGFARIGVWMLAATAVSCAAFLALPFTAAPGLFLAAIAVWAVTSAALRSPPWFLLSRHAATPSIPWLSVVVLTGTAVAAAASPYLGIALRAIDPRVPFAVSTVTLLAAVLALVIAERRAQAGPAPQKASAPVSARPSFLFVGLFLLALGFQVHFAVNSVPQYMRVALPGDLPLLMPVFWIGFNLLMVPSAALVKRLGPAPLMAMGAALGALAMLAVPFSTSLEAMIAAQLLAGGCWGAACVAAYTAAVALGGRFLGALFAVLALAVALRIAGVATGLAGAPQISALLPWIPQALWLGAGLVLIAARRA